MKMSRISSDIEHTNYNRSRLEGLHTSHQSAQRYVEAWSLDLNLWLKNQVTFKFLFA